MRWLTNQCIQHKHKVWVTEKYLFYLLVTVVATLQEVRINVYFILISESSPYVLSYSSIYRYANTVGYFSNVLSEILFTNTWRQSFVKLPIQKLTLHNSAAFLSSAKVSQKFAWKSNFLTSTPASLNYTLSVSQYVTTNVTAKPVTFPHGTSHGCTVVSHMCSFNTLTATRK